jgi:hypothetical protein
MMYCSGVGVLVLRILGLSAEMFRREMALEMPQGL